MIINKITISDKVKVNFCCLNQKKLMLFKIGSLTYYKEIPQFIVVSKNEKKTLIFKTIENTKIKIQQFYLFLSSIQSLQSQNKKLLILKGLGLKVRFDQITNFLEFKLGFSHLCLFAIDKEITVRIKKNILFFQSINKEKLGNFLYKIKSLRFPDVYKGKGIWYKNEKIKLKVVKKK